MKTSDLREILQSAFAAFFARNTAARGSRSYYGVAVSNVRKTRTGITFDLRLTFKQGKRYCCFEDGCHHGLFSKDSWGRVRLLLRKKGWTDPPPLKIAILRKKVEKGACADYGGLLDPSQEVVRKGYQRRAGPYDERKATE
jgi:hypothetical protein